MLSSSSSAHGFFVRPVTKSRVAVPTPSTVMTYPNTPATAMMMKIAAVSFSVDTRMAGRSRNWISR